MTSYPTASSSEALCVVPSLLMTVLLIGTEKLSLFFSKMFIIVFVPR